MNNIEKGKLGEEIAAKYIVSKGGKIIERNYKIKIGEVDLIVLINGELVFVEVKTRRYRSLVSGVEAVGYKKKGRIIATADCFLAEYGEEKQIRYDIAEVTVSTGDAVRVIDFRYFKDAFDTTGYETQF